MSRLLTSYYAATLLFLVADYAFGINVRIAFLDTWPFARLAYYAVCFACLVVILWRPQWQALVSAVESLTVIVTLTLAMGIRVMVPTDAVLESGRPIVTAEQIVNYLISGSVAYFAWFCSIKQLKATNID